MLKFSKTEEGKPRRRHETARALEIPLGWANAIIVFVREYADRISVIFSVIAPGQRHDDAAFFDSFHLSEKALPRLARLAKVTGTAQGDPTEGDWTLNPNDMLGKTLKVQVKHEEYEGETKVRTEMFGLDSWNTPAAEELKIIAQVREGLAESEKRAAAKAAAPSNSNGAKTNHDEVPF